ncbi:MAG TPA: substrate-binding domain-containing protein [Rhodanobacteraceae bacterium]|nr:substrate-binding domain-containing protein [Rhodanobacteraceae bacterium]
MFRRLLPVFLLLNLTFSFLAAVTVSAAEDELLWRGDHATGRTIMDELAKEYAKEKKGKITLQPFSTVSGLDAVAQGTADIAGSARGKYAKRTEESGINFVPVALDAAVMITHPKNPVQTLTLHQVFDIYYGRITNWSALGGEPKDINLYGIAAPLDGVEFSVRDLVYRNGDQRVAIPRLYLNTTKLEEGIAIDPAGLGLSTLASIHGNAGVKPLAIEGIGASTATITDGSYPLYITLYLAEKVDSPKQAAIDRFIEFLGTQTAKDILRKHGLVPYADASDAIARASARTAFIDAHLGREASVAVAAAPATPTPTPVSAPRATLESKTRVAPTAETTEQARANLARSEAAAAEKKEAANAAAPQAASVETKGTVSASAAQPVAAVKIETANLSAVPAVVVEKKPVSETIAKSDKPVAKKKAAVAKADKPAKEVPKKEAPKPATFGNVDAAATTAAKPASFGDVDAGAKSSTDPQKN